MINTIIFDFFGVIRQDSFHGWMDNHGFTREDEVGQISRELDTGLINVDEFYKRLAKHSNQTVAELLNEMNEHEKFDEEVIEHIKSLRTDYDIVLLSNSESKYLRDILRDKNLERLFDDIFISGELGVAKPDREMFKLVLKKIKKEAKQVVFVDDQQKNIDAAEKLGIKGVLFNGIEQLKIDIGKLND